MAEVKNAFIKSKMNKDLDARLIPQGEYRDAVNIQVSKSEGDDVGALENVLGNSSIVNFTTIAGYDVDECIGYFVDEFNSTVYLFFTDEEYLLRLFFDFYHSKGFVPWEISYKEFFIHNIESHNQHKPTESLL